MLGGVLGTSFKSVKIGAGASGFREGASRSAEGADGIRRAGGSAGEGAVDGSLVEGFSVQRWGVERVKNSLVRVGEGRNSTALGLA